MWRYFRAVELARPHPTHRLLLIRDSLRRPREVSDSDAPLTIRGAYVRPAPDAVIMQGVVCHAVITTLTFAPVHVTLRPDDHQQV
jgi:hypothetical protein